MTPWKIKASEALPKRERIISSDNQGCVMATRSVVTTAPDFDTVPVLVIRIV